MEIRVNTYEVDTMEYFFCVFDKLVELLVTSQEKNLLIRIYVLKILAYTQVKRY